MRLRQTIKEFSLRPIERAQLPTVVALRDACNTFQGATRQTERFSDRLARIVPVLKARETRTLDRRDLRFVTTALGNSDSLAEAEAAAILDEIERRHSPSLYRAVFNSLLASYNDEPLRLRLRSFLRRHVAALPFQVQRFCKKSGILDDDTRLQELARELAHSENITHLCVSKNIAGGILASNYGTELKIAALRENTQSNDAILIRPFLDWVFSTIAGTPIGDFYEAMLAPFETMLPQPDVQKLITGKCVEQFRDPRIYSWPGLRGSDGQMRRNRCVAIIKRWLSIEYLDLFIRIIESTAVDKQFRPRKAFWLKYFERDKISEVTLILASEANKAAHRARNREANTEYMKWSKLNSALPDQSVLLMRIGDLIIAEWSHSGALRFWRADDNSAPEFHLPEYLGSQLRQNSLKIRVDGELRSSIHHHENGQWMQWASGAIRHHTGVSV